MVYGWIDLFKGLFGKKSNEFVSVDARLDFKNDQRSYEMLSNDESGVVTSLPSVHLSSMSPTPSGGFKTPDYYGQTARYNPPERSFSSPRPRTSQTPWDSTTTYARPADSSHNYYMHHPYHNRDVERNGDMNPLGMNKI